MNTFILQDSFLVFFFLKIYLRLDGGAFIFQDFTFVGLFFKFSFCFIGFYAFMTWGDNFKSRHVVTGGGARGW